MTKQRGITLLGLLFWGFILIAMSALAIKVVPEYLNFFNAKKSLMQVASDATNKTVFEIRDSFDKYANINGLTAVSSADLEITKEGNTVVMSFAYQKKIHLVANVSLLIDFQAKAASDGRKIE